MRDIAKDFYKMALKKRALAPAQSAADMTNGWHANASRATGWSAWVVTADITTDQ